MGQDLFANLKLLRHHILDTLGICRIDHRAHFRAENSGLYRPRKQRIQIGHGFHHFHAIGGLGQAFIDLQKRHHAALFPHELRGGFAGHLAIHRHFKQNRTDDARAGERGRLGDAGAHGVHQIKHFLVIAIGAGVDAIKLQRLGCRAARLVERCDKSLACADLVCLLGIHLFIRSILSDLRGHRGAIRRLGPARPHRAAACLPSIPKTPHRRWRYS